MSQQKPIARPVTEEAAAPIYRTLEDDYSGPRGVRADFRELVKGVAAIRGRWQCPHCKQLFMRRKPSASHMGLRADHPTSCRVLIAIDERRRDPTTREL
jgi:hypothetical protein